MYLFAKRRYILQMVLLLQTFFQVEIICTFYLLVVIVPIYQITVLFMGVELVANGRCVVRG